MPLRPLTVPLLVMVPPELKVMAVPRKLANTSPVLPIVMWDFPGARSGLMTSPLSWNDRDCPVDCDVPKPDEIRADAVIGDQIGISIHDQAVVGCSSIGAEKAGPLGTCLLLVSAGVMRWTMIDPPNCAVAEPTPATCPGKARV